MGASTNVSPFNFRATPDDYIDQSQLDLLSDDPPPYEPPAYEARTQIAAPDPDEILDPCTLVIRGRSIYSYPITGSPYPISDDDTADKTPEYQLTIPIHVRGTPAGEMVLQRMDPRVRTAADGTPVVSRRAKDIYRLEHRRPMVLAGIPAENWLVPLTRKALGNIRIERSPAFHSGYRALKVRSDAEIRGLENLGLKVKKGEYWFAIKGGKDDCWEWTNECGTIVAHQLREGPADPTDDDGSSSSKPDADAKVATELREEDAVYSLRIVQSLSRRERDSLVALWCLWMWHRHIEGNKPKKTWEDRKRILQMPSRTVRSVYM
ncbi:hypothetical protein VTH82DRAFT_1499 [Thermothelomyces myriococcoides]